MIIDKRKKMIAVIDTETLGVDQPLIYDFAVSICDKNGVIYAQKNWIVEEVFSQREKMQTAYYANKLPLYFDMIEKKSVEVKKWSQIRSEFNQMLKDYNVSVLSAYNLAFDKRAITYTHKCLGNQNKYLTKFVELWDIWGIAAQTIMLQKTFHKMALREGWYSEKGNVLSNAEVCYRYITNQLDFIESHTALHDTEIEVEILSKALKQHKKLEKGKGIFYSPWQVVQRGKIK